MKTLKILLGLSLGYSASFADQIDCKKVFDYTKYEHNSVDSLRQMAYDKKRNAYWLISDWYLLYFDAKDDKLVYQDTFNLYGRGIAIDAVKDELYLMLASAPVNIGREELVKQNLSLLRYSQPRVLSNSTTPDSSSFYKLLLNGGDGFIGKYTLPLSYITLSDKERICYYNNKEGNPINEALYLFNQPGTMGIQEFKLDELRVSGADIKIKELDFNKYSMYKNPLAYTCNYPEGEREFAYSDKWTNGAVDIYQPYYMPNETNTVYVLKNKSLLKCTVSPSDFLAKEGNKNVK